MLLGDKPIVVTPEPAQMKITGQQADVWITKWEDIVSDGVKRRRVLGSAGSVGAVIILVHGLTAGDLPASFSAAGFVLDIAGAALLTTGLMLPEWAAREMATTRYGESKSVRTYWEQTGVDAKIAFVFLVAGFIGQGLGIVF